MAKVIRIHENGGPSVLRIENEDVGAPGPGEARLRQTFVGINYVDVMVREGVYPQPLPTVPGFEAAGVVDAVGPGVSGFAPGDRVAYFFAAGSYASEKNLPANALVKLPDDISPETAATFISTGLTAWTGLRAMHQVKAGQAVLVLGASGSVGSVLVRWARALGATVIGVAGSASKLAKVEAGATHAFLASDPDLAAKIRVIAPNGVDAVYDLVGQATFDLAVAAVRDGGAIVTLGARSGQPRASGDLARRGVTVTGGGMPQYVRGPTVAIATGALWAAIREGLFADIPTVRYPFDEVARAHADMDARTLEGLPVLMI